MGFKVASWLLVLGLCISGLPVLVIGPQLAEASVAKPSIINPITHLTGSVVLTGYSYQKPITITNSGSSLTDYQMLFEVDTASLILAGKMLSDCGDLRFATSTGTELLYWIESGANTSATKVWVKIQSIPAGTSTIYMCYGNSSATSAGDGDATFIFFDDFDTIDTTKWNQTTGWSVSNGVIYADANDKNLVSVQSWSLSRKAVHARVKTNEAGPWPQARFLISASDGTSPDTVPNVTTVNHSDGSSTVDLFNGYISSIVTYSTSWDTNWHDVIHKRADGSVAGLYDGESKTMSTGIPDTIYVAFRVDGGTGTVTLCIDNVFVRKYVESEPTYSFGSEEAAAGLVAHLRFEENSGSVAYDETANNNDGTIYGATWVEGMTISGVSGTALSFDGVDDYIYKDAEVSGIGGTNQITLEAWIKRGSAGGSHSILAVGDCDAYTFIRLALSNDALQPIFCNDANNDWRYLTTTSTLTDTANWHHVAATYNAGTIKVYVDGVEWTGTYTGSWTGAVVSPTVYFRIGNSHIYGGNSSPFHGIIDEVKIYNEARAAAQILADYQTGEPPVVNNLPTAFFTYSPNTDITTENIIQFTDESTDSDSTIASWYWSFGDGATSTSQNPTYQYSSAGTYTVTLTVTDNGGATNSTSQTIPISEVAGPVAHWMWVIVIAAIALVAILIAVIWRHLSVGAKRAEKVLKQRKIKPQKLAPAQIEFIVYKYIKRHRGELDVRRCAKKLGLSEREVEMAVEILKVKGKVTEE